MTRRCAWPDSAGMIGPVLATGRNTRGEMHPHWQARVAQVGSRGAARAGRNRSETPLLPRLADRLSGLLLREGIGVVAGRAGGALPLI
ncbi:uncharacterized protein J3R85_005161 [Psidium guajava]|nr:uncharacterized protein J3R85_005161 [Psidium guajava]